MYIRTREDAVDALAVILELPTRAAQIIELTMRIALCLDPYARIFLADCQAALIEGGLDALRKRRHEQLAALARSSGKAGAEEEPFVLVDAPTREDAPDLYAIADSLMGQMEKMEAEVEEMEVIAEEPPAPEPVVVPDTEPEPEPAPEPEPQAAPEPPPPPEPEPAAPPGRIRIESSALSEEMLLDPLLEEVGAAMDLVKMAEIASEVFPNIAKRPRWEIGRLARKDEKFVRGALVEGMQHREDASKLASIEQGLIERINEGKPWWSDWDRSLREACRQAAKTLKRFHPVHERADDADLILDIIAMSDDQIRGLLDMITKSPADAVGFISTIRTRLDWLITAQEKSGT